jgi:hypothetical protein
VVWHDFNGGLVNKRLSVFLAAVVMAPVTPLAQEKPQATAAPPADPISLSERGLYSFISSAVIRAAEKMPEENYSFKPTPEVRSFGQLGPRGGCRLHVLLDGLR